MNKKIAFLFLIYDKINHENIWIDFFKQDTENKCTIYIHYKYNIKSDFFEKYKLKECVETAWGDISLVRAQNLLLTEAFKDPYNQHFIFCSNSCIPFKTFNYVYNFLNESFSYFNILSQESCFPRCTSSLNYIDKDNVKKASQWCILNRNHTKKILETDIYFKWFKDTVGDEHCYITYLYYIGEEANLIRTFNSAESATTFTNWPDMIYRYGHRIPNIKNYHVIGTNEILFLLRSRCLFGRKFSSDCNLILLRRLLDFEYKHQK